MLFSQLIDLYEAKINDPKMFIPGVTTFSRAFRPKKSG